MRRGVRVRNRAIPAFADHGSVLHHDGAHGNLEIVARASGQFEGAAHELHIGRYVAHGPSFRRPRRQRAANMTAMMTNSAAALKLREL